MNRRLLLLAAGSALLPAAAAMAAPRRATKQAPLKVIGFMTDFDLKDDAVAICKAVMDGIAPGVRILDITHAVEPYNIAQAARFLAGAAPYLPADAVIVVVVDPGVGSARKAIIARSKRGQSFVLPDNGLLTLLLNDGAIVGAREITNTAWMIGARRSSTFHGRDIFSPAAAHLARGEDWTLAGPALDVSRLVRLDLHAAVVDAAGARAEAIGTDGPYGNLITNLTAEQFARLGYAKGDLVTVSLDARPYIFPLEATFSDVAVGKPLLYIDSRGRLAMAVNEGNFAEVYQVGEGAKVVIGLKGAVGP